LAFGKNDDLFVQDSLDQTISTYVKPYTGNPINVVHLGGVAESGAFALTAGLQNVWTPYVTNSGEVSGANYDLAAGGLLYQTATQGGRQVPNGIAVDPPFIP